MASIDNNKHVFPGSNTPFGFYPYYDNIMPQENANKIFIIKGGPGTGKSSFMKKVANYFIDKGIAVEFHHCSADPNSLDAIVIINAAVAIIDGTMPHVMDPQNPGIVDEILNFAPYWKEKQIRTNKAAILETNSKRKKFFAKSYFYLDAAKKVYDAYAQTQNESLNDQMINTMEKNILHNLFKNYNPSNTCGKSRHLFGSAITPDGVVDYLHTIIGNIKDIYLIKDAPGASAKNIMNLILSKGIELGLYMECYHSPIDIKKIEDIIIPSLDIAITVSNDYHKPKVFPAHVFDLTSCFVTSTLKEVQFDLDKDKKLFNELLDKGITTLKKAKEQHEILESYYTPHVDFDKINNLLTDVILQIENFL